MRILHVLNSAGGGATASLLNLVRASKEAGTGIEHFAVYPGAASTSHPRIVDSFHGSRTISLWGWNVDRSENRGRRLASAGLRAWRTRLGTRTFAQIRAAVEAWQIDLITTNCAANIDGALAARKLGLPHVWHIRERIGTNGSMYFALADDALVARVAGLSTRVAVVSEYVAEPFRRYAPNTALSLVYEGVDRAAFANPEAAQRGRGLRAKWGIPEDTILVGKVANVTAGIKRHELFLEAASIISRQRRDVHFVVVGAVPQPARWSGKPSIKRWHRLQAMADQLGIVDRLVWTGFVDDPPAVMNAIDILAHACPVEGFSCVVIEAMAAGRPVVGPSAGAIPEVVGDEVPTLLVEPGSAEALASRLSSLIADPELRLVASRRGAKRVEARFTHRHYLSRMTDLYQSVVQ